ncbi:MAG TPA: peptidyl-prolyl cis-trans isomerase [Smithellaceae bacterium]|nr:peptidyl-prolyl cis-trans isomerase [Smithellaceae bacterium]
MMKKMINRCCGFIFLILALFPVGCDNSNVHSRPYVATVNGEKIYLDEYQLKLSQKKAMLPKGVLAAQPGYANRLEEEVLDNIITEKIMFLRAQRIGLEVGPEELEKKINEIRREYGDEFFRLLDKEKISYDQWKEALRKEMLFEKLIQVDVNSGVRVSEDEAEDYFYEHNVLYKSEPQVRVAQIVVRDMDAAQQSLRMLNAGVDFSEVAKKKSIGPEASRGGDLGFITRQVMPEPLDETIFNLPAGKISPIVQSPYGFHIFKVLEIRPAKIKNFAESKEEVMADILARKKETAFINWLEALKVKAVIKKESAVLRGNVK